MAVDPVKATWVQHALGVVVAGATEHVETISPVRLAKCRMIWTQTVNNVHTQVQSLKTTMLGALRASDEYDEDELEAVEEAVQEIDDMVAGIDMSLIDMVDAVINADPPPPRVKAQRAAIGKADELTKYVSADPDFALVDKNEYLPTNVKALTLASLGAIRKELSGI